jgi:7-cyano-7-deazaguanine synthase
MKALILGSGGADSTTLLALAVQEWGRGEVAVLAIAYGQRHGRELQAARAVAEYYGVPIQTLDLSSVFAGSNSSLLGHSHTAIPEGSYAAQQWEEGKTLSTYVPFRNGLFLSAAASVALSLDCSLLYYGAHHDDWAGSAYPDCSPAFAEEMGRAIARGSGGGLELRAPFIRWSKAQIVKRGLELGVPYALTWSCYEGGALPCGRCATCLDRARAFAENGAADPLIPTEKGVV